MRRRRRPRGRGGRSRSSRLRSGHGSVAGQWAREAVGLGAVFDLLGCDDEFEGVVCEVGDMEDVLGGEECCGGYGGDDLACGVVLDEVGFGCLFV